MKTDTKAEYERWVNDVDIPDDDKKSNGGRIPDDAQYGTWLRRHDPVAFNVGYQEWARENRYLHERGAK